MITSPLCSVFISPVLSTAAATGCPADASILCDKSVMPDETVKRLYDANLRPDLLLSRFCQ